MTTERRAAGELRAAGRRLVGYAARFGTEADIAGLFRETIRAGAFKRSLATAGDILALVDHDASALLARTRSGTLRLAEDGQGLAFEIDLPSTRLADDLLALAERGDLGGASFAFTVPKGGERWQGRSRELLDVDLIEVSVVQAWPAYPDTAVAARMASRQGLALRLARLRTDFL